MSITRYLLASDLDGTLIPLERDAQRLREVEELVRALAASEDLRLAYVTGRHLALAQAGIEEIGLPSPDWFVCDVGTSVYRRANGGYEPDQEYRQAMRAALGGWAATMFAPRSAQWTGWSFKKKKSRRSSRSAITRRVARSRLYQPYNRGSTLRRQR
jgi:hypothetical protein